MSPFAARIFIPESRASNLPLPAAVTAQTGRSGQAPRNGGCRLRGASTRCWMPAVAALILTCASAPAQGVFTPQPVGVSATASILVTAQAKGVVSKVAVLTLGVSGAEFTAGSGTSTCPATTMTVVGQQCTESVAFSPAYPGLRMGAVVLIDSAGGVLGTNYVSGVGLGGLGVLVPGNLITVAGDGGWSQVGDGSPATLAELNLPSGVVLDGAGNMYIADSNHHRVRLVTAKTGIISTIAGSGNPAYGGDGKLSTDPSVALNTPSGVALDGAGNLYIADTGNNRIRKITRATGIITTVAGPGTHGTLGDGRAATSAYLSAPRGVTVSGDGSLYIADTYNQRIRHVNAGTGIITTVAGNGDQNPDQLSEGTYSGDGGQAIRAGLNQPYAVVFDLAGNMYIPDSANNVVRMVTPAGVVGTFAGYYPGNPGDSGNGGLATAAVFNTPFSLAVDPAGNVYIADSQNNAIRKVSASTGLISTLTPGGAAVSLSDGMFTSINIYGPLGLFLDNRANLYFADYFNMRIQQFQSDFVGLNYAATPIRQGNTSVPQDQTVENEGNSTLDLTAITPAKNAAVDDASLANPCSDGTLAVDADCQIGVVFAPSSSLVFPKGVSSEPITTYVDVYGNPLNFPRDKVNSPLEIELLGEATAVNSTTVVLTSTPNPSDFGQSVLFTATVTTGAGTGNLTGTVTLHDGAKVLQSGVALSTGGVASFRISTLAVGSHTMKASYSGDTGHFASTSSPLTQVVDEATAVQLTSSRSPSAVGTSVTFTATVTISGGGGLTPAGTVIFTDTTIGTILGAQTLGPSGIVSVSTAVLAYGPHAIEATYGGDAPKHILSSSATLTQDVQTPSTVSLRSSTNPSIYGMPVVFTVTVATAGAVSAAGTVNILEQGQANPIGTVTLSGNPGSGTYTTSSLPAGTDTITAAYLGNPHYGPGTSTAVNQVVNLAQTSTTVDAVPDPGIAGAPVSITATVRVTQGVATPTGAVTFTDGTNSLGSVNLGATGTATIRQMLAIGPHSIVATYGGDTNDDKSASAALPLTVVQATTQTSVTATPPSALVRTSVNFTAKVTGNGGTPTGSVTFTANSTSIGSARLDTAGTATVTYSELAAGSYTITAVYGGDTDDQGSTGTDPAQLVVGTIPTVTDLGISTTAGPNPQVILVATVLNNPAFASSSLPVPTGTVIFNSMQGKVSTPIGSAPLDSNGVATLPLALPTGTYQVEAVYTPDPLHRASTSNVVSVSTTAAGFNLTVTPDSVTIPTTQSATMTVDLTSRNGFADTIGLGCASLPAAVNCHFSTPSVPLTSSGAAKVQLIIDTNNPLGGGASAMNAHTGIRDVLTAGIFLPVSVLFGCILWAFRKRHRAVLTLAWVLALSAAALLMNGCGGFTQSSAAPGTYVIQVTGIGAKSDIAHYENVTLIVTQ